MAITMVTLSGGTMAECKVAVDTAPRPIAFGEADQKAAHVSVVLASPPRDAATLVITVDTDMLAQQCVLAAQRPACNDNLFIAFLPHAMTRRTEPRYVDCYGFPKTARQRHCVSATACGKRLHDVAGGRRTVARQGARGRHRQHSDMLFAGAWLSRGTPGSDSHGRAD